MPTSDAWPKIAFRPLLSGYRALMDHHRHLLDDEVRTHAMIAAIESQVRSGDVVIDMGCGTGVLALAAARAGAKRVYAIEIADIAHAAERIAQANGFGDRIQVIRAHARDALIPEPADVIVSECFGVLGFGSTMLESLCELRARALRPGGVVIPRALSVHLAAVESAACEAYANAFASRRYGFDLSPLGAVSAHNLYNARITPDEVCSTSARVGRLELSVGRHDGNAHGSGRVTMLRSARVHGLVGWFAAELGDGHGLDTAPGQPDTVWRQVFLPLEPEAVERDQPIEVELSFTPHRTRVMDIAWGARLDGERWARRSTAASYPVPA